MEDDDFLLALRLQEQFDLETSAAGWSDEDCPSSKKRKIDFSAVIPFSQPGPRPERPLSIVDESWETLDPNPDVRAMFLQFNDRFFWGKLSGVEVKWSPRMTLCAGVCSYEGRGGLCSIRLSEPLLKLRPRKDLVQTLLHEMIHALLFVTQNNTDRDGHGPEFCKHMDRINQASGTKITIYHSFHDEVDVYRQHWWRCNGPCQNRRPFFGYVKRAMNRPPSARDPWWTEHQRTCGGTYTKIKEPENYGKTGKGDKKKDTNPSNEISKGSKPPSSITGVSKSSKPPSSTSGSGLQDIRNVIPFSGRGFILGGNTQTSTNKPSQSPPKAPPEPLVSPPDSPVLPRLWPIETNLPKRVSKGASNVPRRKSVSNTNAFINVNGSPVRISKGKDLRGKQRSVQDLFQAIVLKSPERAASAAGSSKPATDATTANPDKCNGASSSSALDTKPFGKTSLINNHHSSTTTGPKPDSIESYLSKYFGSVAKTEFPESKSKASGSPQKSATSTPGHVSTLFGSPQKSATSTPGHVSTLFGSNQKSATSTPGHVSTLFGSNQKSATSTPGHVSTLFGSNQKLGSDAASSGFRNTGSPQSSHTSTTSGSGSKHSGKPESNFPSPGIIGSPRTSGTTPSGAKKRSWEEHNSEQIFDYFQRTVGESANSAVQQREEVGDAVPNDPPVHVTVHCPVCHIKVPEYAINEHLDSCLL
ncbi:DNA-dependent metalloprotease SPRTN isoform X3 [Pimephales promelas]|uniref:DNA-dependent metalloprotease SPRTN isoform X3 n=1 Tax=Pimephales promelas TaxID=90988 RepID=UPI001955AFC8|nr:DNA-dependent metalloprotease SPRTN isoform X3 [Pimephales promelas]